jgi:hypothetical protein
MKNLLNLHQEYVLFVVEYDLLDEQHLILHFDLIFQEQIVVHLNFQLMVHPAIFKQK